MSCLGASMGACTSIAAQAARPHLSTIESNQHTLSALPLICKAQSLLLHGIVDHLPVSLVPLLRMETGSGTEKNWVSVTVCFGDTEILIGLSMRRTQQWIFMLI